MVLFGQFRNKILGIDSKAAIQTPWCALETYTWAMLWNKSTSNEILKGYHTCFDCPNNLTGGNLLLMCDSRSFISFLVKPFSE